MMDLDDLKHINDTYGHDWGDHYIRNTGRCIAEHSPPGTVCARLSGDEFLLLFYGYPGREQLREKLEVLTRAMQQAVVVLPSGSDLHISISRRRGLVPGGWPGHRDPEKICRLCHVSGQALHQGADEGL